MSSVAVSGGFVYWLEGRPAEGGRSVLVERSPDGTVRDLTPAGFNVRTRVHEYGGGAYVLDGRTLYFANFADQRLYVSDLDAPGTRHGRSRPLRGTATPTRPSTARGTG